MVGVENCPILGDTWVRLETLLPNDLDATAASSGALVRRREVKSAAALLRLTMAYGYCDLSLRATAAWAGEQQIAEMSDVALLKRLKKSSDWLALLLTQKLAERVMLLRDPRRPAVRARIVDATYFSRVPGQDADWRIHLGFDLARPSIDQVVLAAANQEENQAWLACAPGDILIGERSYAHRGSIAWAMRVQAHLVVRLNWRDILSLDRTWQSFDMLAEVRNLRDAQILDMPATLAPRSGAGEEAARGRYIAVRRSPEQAESDRERLARQAREKAVPPDQRTVENAAYLFVFTTLPPDTWPGSEVLALYRFRWQVEMAFRRMKRTLTLDEMAAKDEQLCRTYLLARLLTTLLLDDLARSTGAAFSPWGYGLPGPTGPPAPDPEEAEGP